MSSRAAPDEHQRLVLELVLRGVIMVVLYLVCR